MLLLDDRHPDGRRTFIRLNGKQPKLPLAARKTIHRRYRDPDDNASLADLAQEYSVGRSTIHRIVSGTGPRA
ncbi:hypothetical protein [Nocardia sp. NPDC004260]